MTNETQIFEKTGIKLSGNHKLGTLELRLNISDSENLVLISVLNKHFVLILCSEGNFYI